MNGKSDGSTAGADVITTRLLAHLPLLLGNFSNAHVAVVGFGTGISPGSLSLYPGVKDIDCIELSSAVEKLSENFDFINHGVTHNPKFHWKNADAYRYLASRDDRFDLIISEPSNPWIVGVERLYSAEFYTRALKSLKDNGLFAQWFHTYSISPSTLKMVLHTFGSVFPNVRIFANPMGMYDIIILGSRETVGVTELENFSKKTNKPEIRKELEEIGLASPESLLSLEVPAAAAFFSDGALHTLDFPKLSFAAGKDFFQEENSDISQIVSSGNSRHLLGTANRQSLMAQWSKRHPLRNPETLFQLARVHCNRKNPEFVDGWNQSSKSCQQLLIALATYKLIPEKNIDSEALVQTRELMGLQALGARSSPELRIPINLAKTAIRTFASLDSEYLPLRLDILMKRSAPCLASTERPALECRAQLVETLIDRGYLQEARGLLDQLNKSSEQMPRSKIDRLNQIVNWNHRISPSR